MFIITLSLLSGMPLDFGPIYRETLMGRFPVEPWNTISNLIFLVVGGVSILYTRLRWSVYPLATIITPIILIGWLGGTLYHALRDNSLWLLLDFLPIALATLIAMTFFWARLLQNWFLAFIVGISLALSGRAFLMALIYSGFAIERRWLIGAGYASMALAILLPIFLYEGRLYIGKKVKTLIFLPILAGGSFLVALISRTYDMSSEITPYLPMGTHFLWHIFGGVSVGLLLIYDCKRAKDDHSL